MLELGIAFEGSDQIMIYVVWWVGKRERGTANGCRGSEKVEEVLQTRTRAERFLASQRHHSFTSIVPLFGRLSSVYRELCGVLIQCRMLMISALRATPVSLTCNEYYLPRFAILHFGRDSKRQNLVTRPYIYILHPANTSSIPPQSAKCILQ